MKIARNLELFPWPVLEPAFGVPTTGELTNPAFYALLALMKPDYRISGIRNARDDDDAIGANPFGNPLVSDF